MRKIRKEQALPQVHLQCARRHWRSDSACPSVAGDGRQC